MNLNFRVVKYTVSLPNVLAIAGSFLFILAFFSKLFYHDIDTFFSADALYLPSIYKDLFIDGNSLKEWNLNPAPNFFPDMILYFMLMCICKQSFIISSFVFSIIQYAVILYLVSRIFRAILPNVSKHWISVINLLLSLFLMEYLFFTKEYFYSFYLLSNAFHTGSFVMSLFCFLLSLRYYQKNTYKMLLLIFIVSVLCIISDRLFIVLYCIPAFVSAFFLINKVRGKLVLAFLITLVITVVTGLFLFNWISNAHYFNIDNPHQFLAFEGIKSSFELFSGQILIYLSEFGCKSISIYLFLLSFIIMIFLFFKTRKEGNILIYYYSVFSIVFSLVVLSAPILNGNYTGYDTLRYNIYPFYLMAINIPLFLAYSIKKPLFLMYGKYAITVLSVVYVSVAVSSIDRSGLRNYFTYYPEKVKAIDQLSQQYGLLQGVGNYWEAKTITLFSKKNVKVYAVFENLSMFCHVSNNDWFFNGRFNFVLLNRFQDTTLYKKNGLMEEPIYANKDVLLIKTNIFTYKKDKGGLPINCSGSE